jgi:hypothetical protein
MKGLCLQHPTQQYKNKYKTQNLLFAEKHKILPGRPTPSLKIWIFRALVTPADNSEK